MLVRITQRSEHIIMVCATKHDGRHKEGLAAGEHLTNTPVDSVCSSIISLCGIQLVTSATELNDLEACSTNICNAHLELKTQERLHIIAGPEFGARQGHILVVIKALHGLKISCLHWYKSLMAI